MLFAPHTFLAWIKQIVTGGGRDAAGQIAIDAGFLRDVPTSVDDILPASIVSLTDNTAGTANNTLEALTSGTVYATDVAAIRNNFADLAAKVNTLITTMQGTAVETNLRVSSSPASTTAAGTIEFTIPRDYDEATDTLALRLMAAMAGATDTPVLTLNVYRKRAGVAIATVATGVAMSTIGAVALNATAQMVQFDLSQKSLLRDDVIVIQIVAGAHTTDALYIYSAYPIYRSTIVSYNETDSSARELR